MILRPSARPQTLLQAIKSPSCIPSRIHHRSKHTVPALLGAKDEVFSRYGVPGFLSAGTYKESWMTYQTHLCAYLNAHVAGTTYESLPVRSLHETLSRRPADAALYNRAAMAHHNHFYWNSLSDSPDPTAPSRNFQSDIEECFESLPHLRDEFTDSALSLFGNGFVWLMTEVSSAKTLSILCTYNAGSPFPAAHTRRQSQDFATGADLSRRLSQPQNYVGSFGDNSMNRADYHQSALKALPILCLNMWEHMWIRDYGLTGKENYVKNWWERIDWDEVLNRYNLVPTDERGLPHVTNSRLGLGGQGAVGGTMRDENRKLLSQVQRSMPQEW